MTIQKLETVPAELVSKNPGTSSVSGIKVLSLSTSFPNKLEPGAGTFIRSRLQAMGAHVDIRVAAPVAALRFTDLRRMWRQAGKIAPREQDGSLVVLRSRWVYPPLASASNALWLFLQLARPLSRVRREFPFQVIDAHFGFPEAVTAALLARRFHVPFIVTLRGSEVEHGRYRLRRRQMSWALGRAARVIVLSERLRQFALSLGVAPQRVVTIPNGVDSTTFFPRDRNACRERHGIRPAERIILCAGHLIELKGHHRIVHSLKRLVQDGTQARLLIAGGSGHRLSYEQVIRSEVSSLGLQESVSFLGHVEPEMLAELMCAADVFCLASSREGWPNVVHEAMSCGTPVVATDVGAIPEMIPSEDYGLIVPVNDGAALAGALHRALLRQWDRAAIAAHGQSRSWAEVAREVVSELQHIAGGRG